MPLKIAIGIITKMSLRNSIQIQTEHKADENLCRHTQSKLIRKEIHLLENTENGEMWIV